MARRSISLVTGPEIEPVTLADLKTFARLDTDEEDGLLVDFITTARQAAENYTRRAFITQSWKLSLDLDGCGNEPWWDGVREGAISALYGGLPSVIQLPKPPLISIVSVTTYDLDNSATTLSSSYYTADTAGNRFVLAQSATWPSNLRPIAAAEIVTSNGYGSAGTIVPGPIRTAILMHAAKLYEERGMCGDDLPANCQQLLRQYRVMDGI